MSVDRPVESWAFKVVRQVLGVEVEPYDVCGRQSAVDALLHYPDGRVAALEVSSIGPAAEAELDSVLARPGQRRRTVEGLTRSWMVTVTQTFHPSDLRKVDQMLLRCEEHGFSDLTQLYAHDYREDRVDNLLESWISEDVVKARVRDVVGQGEPIVDVGTFGVGGGTGNGADLLYAALLAELRSTTMLSKIEKLEASGHTEQHLFLHVRMSAFAFAIIDTLYFGGLLPTSAPELPGGLDQVWLASGSTAGGVVRAVDGQGWVRDQHE